MTEPNDAEALVCDLLGRWAWAEVAGDIESLDAMAVDSYHLVGPAGFVLTKQEWIERYRSSTLRTSALTLDDIELRFYGHAAVSIGVQRLSARYGEHPAGGVFRSTHFCVMEDGAWRLAGQHLSPIVSPPTAIQH